MSTILPESFKAMNEVDQITTTDLPVFVRAAASRGIGEEEAGNLFDFWRSHRLNKKDVLNSAAWRITPESITVSSTHPMRGFTEFHRK